MQLGVGLFGRRFRSSPEVKIEIENFKIIFLKSNLYHLIRSLSKCPSSLTSPEVETSTSGYGKKTFSDSSFLMSYISQNNQVIDLSFKYVVDTVNI